MNYHINAKGNNFVVTYETEQDDIVWSRVFAEFTTLDHAARCATLLQLGDAKEARLWTLKHGVLSSQHRHNLMKRVGITPDSESKPSRFSQEATS